MLILYLSSNPAAWIIPMLIQIISYVFILRKMGKRHLMGIIPVLGEMEMSQDLFRRMRSFWRPAILTAALMLTTIYIGSGNEYSMIMKFVSFTVYGIFLIRLYSRLAKQFGKNMIFALGLILIPLVFLPVLAFGKSKYLGKMEFKPEKPRTEKQLKIRKTVYVILSGVELLALVLGCFFVTIMVHPAKPVVRLMMNELTRGQDSVTATDDYVSRFNTIGSGFQAAADRQRSRDYFFGDHSNDSKVVVMEYVIGSNLEDGRGCASINIAQMKDATAKGEGLDFVVQAGGSRRWFTDGIKDATVGRYLISGGKLTESEMLPEDTCMSEPDNLKDFIVWAKDNNPADRYMLVLWDHGGGFSNGYGSDDLNKRQGSSTMEASEIIKAIKDSGVKFDLIGFDACLMQNIEYANALEPYADYYLASEETEPGTGWFYTAGFGKLAEDPTISTEDFGCAMVSSFDQLNRARNNGKPEPADTLSLVDLTLVKPVYKELTSLYKEATDMLPQKPAVFTNMSVARSKAYEFYDKEQVDMISYLTNLKRADYKEQVAADKELDDLVQAVKLCVVCRNRDSAEGVNGISIDFPYSDLYLYEYEYKQLKAVKYRAEEKFFNSFCSIIASQQKRQADDTEEDSLLGTLLGGEGYTDEEWYVKGFEDYDTADLFVDIPVTESGGAYLAELPKKTWDAILDCSTAAYMETEDGLMYLGQEHFEAKDADGHPLVVASDSWAHIGGRLVCYESEGIMETDDSTIYKGTVRARLNDEEDVTLHIEWDPAGSDEDEPASGRITGYSIEDDNELFFMQKGLEELKSGDVIEFLFDFYDEEGNYVKTDVCGDSIRVVTQDKLTVKDEAFEDGADIEYYGVFTDVYQRELMTEAIISTDAETE